MALTVVEKTWLGATENNEHWCLFGPPGDITAPTAPTIETLDIESNAVTVRVSDPSLDAQTGVQDYVFTVNGTDLEPVGKDTAEVSHRIGGLSASTAYTITAKARDGSELFGGPNVSEASNALSITTDAAPITISEVFRNWPIMNVSCQQGDIFQGAINTTHRAYSGEKDVLIVPWFYPTNARKASRATGLDWIQANYPHCRLIQYVIPNEAHFNYPSSPGSSSNEVTKELADDVTEGNPNWYVRRLNGDKVGCNFNPTLLAQMNMATNDAGLNSLGERYDQAFFRMIDERFNDGTPANYLDTYFDGLFIDNLNTRPPDMFLLGSSTTTVSDYDFDDDGVQEVRNLYTSASTAGGRMWEEGALNVQDTIRTQFPSSHRGKRFAVIPNAARWDFDYFGSLPPPLPLSDRLSYGAWNDLILDEQIRNNIGIAASTSAYSFNGGGSMSLHFRRSTLQELWLGSDADSVFGRAAVLYHTTLIDRTPTSADYALARLVLCMALLMPRAAPCVSIATTKPMPLDELFLALGEPLSSRSMGTLNEATLAWTMRAPNYESGVADFHWTEFEDGIAIVRTDSPTVGVWPSADAAVACVLPSAGTGKKWQRINAATYVNPTTGYAMRSQDLTTNSGADVTSVSLKPYHGIIVRRVDS
jgi:hypothetical protein